MDGELLGADDAPPAASDPANTAALEWMHCTETPKGTAVFRLQDHLERFLAQVKKAGVEDYPHPLGKLYQAVHRVVCANSCLRCQVQIQLVWEGARPVTLISMRRGEGHRTYDMQTGVKARFSDLQNNPEVFWMHNGRLYVAASGVHLGSIARDSLITLATDAGMRVVQAHFSREQLLNAEELFRTSPPIDVLPVIEVDGHPIASGTPGTLTLTLRESLEAAAHGSGGRVRAWLEPLDETIYAV